MLARIAAIALNSYREAVRARILYGILGIALATMFAPQGHGVPMNR